MAAHSSVLAWRIPGTGEPGGLPSMGVAQSWTRLKWLSSIQGKYSYIIYPKIFNHVCFFFLSPWVRIGLESLLTKYFWQWVRWFRRCIWYILTCLCSFPGGSDSEEFAMREMRVRSLGKEDPLEKGMATHSSTLAWRIPWTEEPGGLVRGVTESDRTEWLPHTHRN